MDTKAKSPGVTAPVTGHGTDEKVKSKRGGARKLPEGMTKVTFLIPTAEFDHLARMADDDDRKAEDLCRVLARGAVKKYLASKDHTTV